VSSFSTKSFQHARRKALEFARSLDGLEAEVYLRAAMCVCGAA
jgi:hypothetical protein